MTYTTLKTTAAALALTAGTAWAGDDYKKDAEMQQGTEAESAIPAIDEAEVKTPANAEMQDRADDMQAQNDDAPQEVETLQNAQMGNSTMVPDSGVGVTKVSEFDGMTVADLIGVEVETASGEDVGEIDYVIEQDGAYAAIVGVGGFLGMGEHDVAVPLADMTFSEDDEVTLANWTEEKLKAQPDLDEDKITALDDDTLLDIAS